MTAARCHRAFRAVTGWWATAARALALVMALAVAAPLAGLAEDFAFHQDHARTEFAMVPDANSDGAKQAYDPGLSCHVHCGCHIAANLNEADVAPLLETSHPCYAWTAEMASSVFPDRLPRPPRA